ncbi:MAG: hypothetical protein RL210_906 [Pseudomonadota bacterium]|jgi:hypothetical protein
MNDPPQQDLQLRILTYLDAHPGAGDTIDGVWQWWLGAKAGVPPQQLEALLLQMVAAGLLRAHLLPDGRQVFSR